LQGRLIFEGLMGDVQLASSLLISQATITSGGIMAVQSSTRAELSPSHVPQTRPGTALQSIHAALPLIIDAFRQGGGVSLDVPSIRRPQALFRDHYFSHDGQEYRLQCAEGLCTVSQLLPTSTSFGEEVLQALAAVVTLGMASCSADPQTEFRPVAQFPDVEAQTELPQQEGVEESSAELPEETADQDCMDSDGKNYLTKGFVIVNAGTPKQQKHLDVCKDNDWMYEQTCLPNGAHKPLPVRCSDVSPELSCVQDATGAKCDYLQSVADSGSFDSTSSRGSDASSNVDAAPDVPAKPDVTAKPDIPPVDYLKQNPLPLALDLTGNKGLYIYYGGNVSCVNGKNAIKSTQLSQCLYLNALFDVDGKPIVATSYSDLVKKITSGGEFFTALITGDKEFPKLAIGKPVGFKHAKLVNSKFDPTATENMPVIAHVYPEGSSVEIGIEFYEKTSPTAPNYTSCYATYWAPSGFASCAK
jgi:hypothetical protein